MAERRARPISLRDVAKQAGVSYPTASRALDPRRARLVAPATRERVTDAARLLGYRPDLVARALRRNRTQTIGLLVADLSNPFYTPLVHGVSDVLDQHGYMTLVAESREDHDRFRRVLDSFTSRRVDAVITPAARRGDERSLIDLHEQLPVVLAARALPETGLPWVGVDDEEGARLAAMHFLDLGHRVVTQLLGPVDIETFVWRTRGFERRIAASDAKLIVMSDTASSPTIEEGRRLMARLLGLPDFQTPLAVFAQNDLMAVGAIQELRLHGYACPDDVSVLGYNDSMLARFTDPPLSTVSQPTYEIGQAAAQLALTLIEGDGTEDLPAIDLPPPAVIVRGSTAPPRVISA